MKKKVIAVIAVLPIILVGALLAYQQFSSSGADRPDNGRWFDCLDQKCRLYWSSSPLSPSLSSEEKTFQEKLDEISAPPNKVVEARLVQLLGRAPDQAERLTSFSRFQWDDYGPGVDPQRGVVIYIYHDQLKKVVWSIPKRFFLTKSFELPEEEGERVYRQK